MSNVSNQNRLVVDNVQIILQGILIVSDLLLIYYHYYKYMIKILLFEN